MRLGLRIASNLWLSAAACGAPQPLTIIVYDYSGVSAEEVARATEVATRAFGHSGIHLTWIHCGGAAGTVNNDACMEGGAITVRLSPRIAVAANSSDMGYAFVTTEGGYYSTVLVPATRDFAIESRLRFQSVLGYAIAHEIGHCLIGPGHSISGLMRARWNRRDAEDIAQERLGLSKREARLAAARICSIEHRRPPGSSVRNVEP
jgi:hypothetical protein